MHENRSSGVALKRCVSFTHDAYLLSVVPRLEDVWEIVYNCTLGTRWRWLGSRPDRFASGPRVFGIHWIGCVGPRAGLDVVAKRIRSLLLPGIEPRSSNP